MDIEKICMILEVLPVVGMYMLLVIGCFKALFDPLTLEEMEREGWTEQQIYSYLHQYDEYEDNLK